MKKIMFFLLATLCIDCAVSANNPQTQGQTVSPFQQSPQLIAAKATIGHIAVNNVESDNGAIFLPVVAVQEIKTKEMARAKFSGGGSAGWFGVILLILLIRFTRVNQ